MLAMPRAWQPQPEGQSDPPRARHPTTKRPALRRSSALRRTPGRGSFDFTLSRRNFTARFYVQNLLGKKYFASTANMLS